MTPTTGGVREEGAGASPTLPMLQACQQAWESFGVEAVQMIPILQAQMTSVTYETERAAMELMSHLRILAISSETMTAAERTATLSQIVMAMQFQDITRQRLEHVGMALEQLKKHMQALLKGPLNPESQQEIAALQRLERSYTMDAERRLHEAAGIADYGEPVPIAMAETEGDSVTLF